MMFIVHRLHELGRTRNTSLEICFIDLAKAHDSVDRVLLWEVLARFGVPPRMIKVIRMFHHGMRARAQLYDGDFSAWFSECLPGPPAKMCAVVAIVQYFFCGGHQSVLQRFAEDR